MHVLWMCYNKSTILTPILKAYHTLFWNPRKSYRFFFKNQIVFVQWNNRQLVTFGKSNVVAYTMPRPITVNSVLALQCTLNCWSGKQWFYTVTIDHFTSLGEWGELTISSQCGRETTILHSVQYWKQNHCLPPASAENVGFSP